MEPDSDAHLQGIAPGDILISLNDQPITGQKELDTLVNALNIGDTVTAVVFMEGEERTITLTVTEFTG